MTCEKAQEAILEFGAPDTEVSAHLAGCESCKSFRGLQWSLDDQLTQAYTAPALNANFRARIRRGIQNEKWMRFWDVAPAFIAPGAGLVISGVCALLVPEVAGLALGAGLVLSAASYVGLLLFTWLTEELGEG